MTRRGFILAALVGAWLVAAGAGLWVLARYEFTPGEFSAAAEQWPVGSRIQREPGKYTLVMAVHPKCPCSRASVGELAKAMARMPGRVSAHVLFVQPTEFTEDWAKTDLWREATAIPEVSVQFDEEEKEARRFGANVSGETLLYDASGRLRYQGGITASRGHWGDSRGRAAVEALVRGEATETAKMPAFGCLLHGPESRKNVKAGGRTK